MKDEDLKGLFLNKKPCSLIVSVRRKNEPFASELAKTIDTTYAHAVKTIQKLEGEGLIESEKRGRKKILSLTDEGEEVASCFCDLFNLMEANGISPSTSESCDSEVDTDLDIKI